MSRHIHRFLPLFALLMLLLATFVPAYPLQAASQSRQPVRARTTGVSSILAPTLPDVPAAPQSTRVTTIPDERGPRAVGVDPFAHEFYVPNIVDGTVSVFDTTTNRRIALIPPGAVPTRVAVFPTIHRAYVTTFPHTVAVINTTTNTVVDTIRVGTNPTGIAVNVANHHVYVTNFYDDTVSVIDTTTDTVVATIPVGAAPTSVAAAPLSDQVYVANEAGHTVSVITGQ